MRHNKRVVFFGMTIESTLIRALAFIKQNPNFDYFFCNMEQWEIVNVVAKIRNSMTLISESNVPNIRADLAMALNDKYFYKVLEFYNSTLINLTDKKLLNSVECSNISNFRTSGFKDSDIVFVKPRFGAGQYKKQDDTLSYKSHAFGTIKDQLFPHHFVQEYVDCPLVISVTCASNGTEVQFVNIAEAFYKTDKDGSSLNTHVESKLRTRTTYESLIKTAINFIMAAKYDTIPGIFMVQFMRDADRLLVNDFNVRSSPALDILSLKKFMIHNLHKTLPFVIGDKAWQELDLQSNVVDYRMYLENADRVILSPLVTNPDLANRILLSDDKQSGIIRNDYNTYAERLL